MDAPNNFNADRPIESAEQDKLGRDIFANQLAERIAAWKGQESLVVGLYGSWSSGKSSVKNLIVERLRKDKELSPVIVEFNPWLVSGEEKITKSFFDEVGSKLEGFQKDQSAEARATSWKKYAQVLEVASQAASAFDFVSPAFGIVSPGAGAWAAKRLKKAKELADGAASSLEKKSVSLHDLKQELREHFRELTKPLLVIIDDIDRLTTEEICLVFRLVKANADFPNIIYLLLFQRKTAEAALDKISNDDGKEYLQKIVQVGFDLPTPSPSSLHQNLFKTIDKIFETAVQEKDWEKERWANVWLGGLSNYFSNIREIYRFLNSFSFMVSVFRHENTLEVNAVDLIAMECFRVFEPDLFAALRNNKSLLTEHHVDYGRGNYLKDKLAASAEELLKTIKGDQTNSKRILKLLFPNLESIWGNMFYGGEFRGKWTQRRRICSPDFFERFFALRLAAGQVSESVIQKVLAACENREALNSLFADLESENLLMPAIERLDAEESLYKLKNPLPYLLSLADISDRLPESQKISMVSLSGSTIVRWAVGRVLKRSKSVEAKIEIMQTLIYDSNSIGLAAEWINDVTEPKEDSIYPKIEGEALAKLKKRWFEKIRAAAKNNLLLNIANLRWALDYWMGWTESSEAKDWVLSLFSDSKISLKFLKICVNGARSQIIGSYYAQDNGWLSWKTLEKFQPREKWENLDIELSKTTSLSDDEKRTLRLFQAALKRWQSGIQDENPRTFEDLETED
jgi:predicted KAP-like P-loop ATPase